MNFSRRKSIALFLLTIISINLITPISVYALTSGPSQPETKGFQPAGVSDMVDLQSGGLKYNVPLLDIDGYPLNLNYQSGSGLEDEASWVGMGWTLNPGAINRQVRGLPDDYSGDEIETDHYTKPKVTVGGRLTSKVEIKGNAKFGGSLTVGVFSDNYTGMGAEVGANAGISFSLANSGMLTGGLGIGVLSNTQNGVDASVSPYVSLSVKTFSDENLTAHAGISGSLGYNSRSGLKSLGLGTSFGYERASYNLSSSNYSFNTEPVSPSVQIPYKTSYGSFSFDVGVTGGVVFAGGGGTGYQNIRQVKSFVNKKKAYGYLYAERGENNPDAVMDFIREKDNPVVPNLPNLAIPIATPDIWSYSSQTGSGQFRLFRGGSGEFFDNQAADESSMQTFGADYGLGFYFHGGLTYFEQQTQNVTRKWTNENDYLAKGDFQSADYKAPNAQHVYFKKMGETSLEDKELSGQISGTQPIAVNVHEVHADAKFLTKTGLLTAPVIAKTSRRPNRTVISYLTANEASKAGLETKIRNYIAIPVNGLFPASPTSSTIERVGDYRKTDHISEISVMDESGKRMVYGIPVYNKVQEEYTFAVGSSNGIVANTNNQVLTPAIMNSNPQGNLLGTDSYYHKEKKAAYASSHLLTAVLSADYIDRTGNGISDDDAGTAIKFNYIKSIDYKWRSPYKNAALNKAQLADPDDDKGSIIYGEKELWYIHSIESKTKIAYFITEDRQDALGVLNWQDGGIDPTQKQKRLKEIRLYSKADMTRPIKVVKFNYNYELCKGTTNNFLPNSASTGSSDLTLGGKLTLKNVWFEYGNTDKGKNHKYSFGYNIKAGSSTPAYNDLNTDRWGIYKIKSENSNGLDNSEYPYTNQDKTVVDANAALWQLNEIDLPTGGSIKIDYESGDYAYVQDKKAMAMMPVQQLIKPTSGATNLYNATGFQVNIGTDSIPPGGVDQTTWFKNTFLNGSDYIYTKFKIKMSTPNNLPGSNLYDFVPCYAKVASVSISDGVASISLALSDVSGVTANPICIAAWQRLKNEYPRFAYPGFNNKTKSGNNSVQAAVTAIISAVKNLSELRKNFYEQARDKGYASTVNVAQSFVRLTKVNGIKLGGAVRVKKIQIEDNWKGLSNNSAAPSGIYGQTYTYTTNAANGRVTSSGVATYEPGIGNDENALKQPIFYDENIKGAITNYFNMELPFCESLYPAPAVGYSKVTVKDLDANNQAAETGFVVSEFYTAKDFPVQVKYLPLQRSPGRVSKSYSMIRSNSIDELGLSQGYSIELNDMHGKLKANRVYNQAGAEVSSSVYYYNTKGNNDTGSLDNNVSVISSTNLQMTTKVLGRDMEFYTDLREQETTNNGSAINIGVDIFPIFFWPFFALPHFPVSENNDYKLFRSVSAIKIVQNQGILDRVVKTQNGSSITTQNIAFDELTGEPVVTKTQNEFNKDIYSVNIPAYWAYKGMGAAYQNMGTVLSAFTTDTDGEINTYGAYLQGGDEIVDVESGTHYWVIDNEALSGSATTKKLIDRDGVMQKSYTAAGLVKIVRSGFRNMLTDNITTLVCLNSPITSTGYLNLNTNGDLTSMKVINASANTYDENWATGGISYLGSVLGIVENTTHDWTLQSGTVPSNNFACVDTGPYTPTGNIDAANIVCNIPGTYFNGQGRLFQSNILPVDNSYKQDGTYEITTTINVPQSKIYYIGFQGGLRFIFDCFDDKKQYTSQSNEWLMAPWFLTAGNHVLTMNVYSQPIGLEIYNNTLSEIQNAGSGSAINVIYSTAQLRTTQPLQTSLTDLNNNLVYHYKYSDGTLLDVCAPAEVLSPVINPYVKGYLGSWRPYQNKVFQSNRTYSFGTNLNKAGVNVKDAGYLSSFNSFWYLNTSSAWAANTGSTKWVTANTVTLYDKYGQQLENRDALDRYSAAKFDFSGELPSAVASNAMNREIYTGTLEDSKFVPGQGGTQTIVTDNRDFHNTSTGVTIKELAVNTVSHSGNYSVQLPAAGLTLSTITQTRKHKTTPYFKLDDTKQYITKDTAEIYPNGFEPSPGKKYIFNAWVKDTHPEDKTLSLSLNVNSVNVPLACKAIVEGWKLVEGIMDLPSVGTAVGNVPLNINIVPVSGSVLYLDDIRIHPFDAHMKTYAYDDKTMRLMAEIDENGFATFYEYDDEGLLVRVKKETEKGVMTIKESRSSYKVAL